MKTVYLYDPTTGEYLVEYSAQESPLEPGEYIYPDASTDNVPLEPKSGYAVCFDNGEWTYKTDIRGLWFETDGEQVEIAALDAVINDAWTREQPLPTPEQLQAQANVEVRAYLDSTDWYVTRFAETGVAIPADIALKRSEARASIV